MAPKGKKGAGGDTKKRGGGGREEEPRELPLQAVILADPFETRFNPFTLEQPRCLLPLANTPLIEYTLEFLAMAGVEEVFVYCGAHTDQVEEYILNSKWSTATRHNTSPFTDLTIIHSTSKCIGEAMRDLDDRAILVNDFLVVYGDVVSNFPLESALAAHKARRAADNNAIMTMVLREADINHRTNVHGYSPIFVLDPKKDRCLHYEQILPGAESRNRILLDGDEVLKPHGEIDIRTDLIDCGIDICTPDVLALWKDNFDLEMPRRDFLVKTLDDFEMTGKTVHTHIVSEHYAARVRNLHAYDAVSRDIVSRWSYPLCPDSNLLRGQSYKLQKGNIYKEQGVVLARSCVVNRRTVIGSGTSMGEGTVVGNSIIGRDCVIGKNVRLEGSYLWDNVTVGDGAIITKAVVASEATIGKKCVVEPGALVSYGVRIGDGITVSGTRRITRKRKRNNVEVESEHSDASVVGLGGDGFDYKPEDDDSNDIDNLANVGLVYSNPAASLSQESISTLHSDDEDTSSLTSSTPATRSAASSFSINDDVLATVGHGPEQGVRFHHEAAESIYDGVAKGEVVDNMQIELQALRLSTNASEHQVRRALVTGFMKRITQVVAEEGRKMQDAVTGVLGTYGSMIGRLIDDVEDQVDLLLLFQTDAVQRKDGDGLLLFVVKELVDRDLVEVEGVEKWWGESKASEKEEMRRVREKTRQLVEFLVEDSEDEDEEEDSEEE